MLRSVVPNWGDTPPRGTSINFKGGASLYMPYNKEILIIKLGNKYVCFYSLQNVTGA